MLSSSFSLRQWKQLFIFALAAVLHVTCALPTETGSADDSISTNSFQASTASDITQARVQEVKTSNNNKIGTSCCILLKIGVGQIVSTSESTTYQTSISSIWSTQAQSLDPGCIVSPKSTSDVSQTVGVINLLRKFGLQCNFAIRSGGHTPWAGASSIQNGVQIDLAALKQVTVASNRKATSIGPGARWLDVYSKLDTLSLTVAGGRDATVGVGGLATGGGISFFSARYGFTVDNVVSFEVVLYDGSIVTASATSRPDLFFALKGGSNNFGIVTRFDLVTFPSGQLWGGTVVYPISTKNASLSAFVTFTGQANYDVYGALIHSYAWTAASGFVIANTIIYTKPVVNPPVFQKFLAIQPQYVNTVRLANHSEFALELAGVGGANTTVRNQIFYTSTWGNDLQTLADIVELSEQYLQTVVGVSGLAWSLTFQPLVTAITSKSASTGGNALGLDASNGNLVLGLITLSWTNIADEPAILAAMYGFFAAADALAASRGKSDKYRYLNYAYKTQEPIKSYGSASLAKLRAASEKYDPVGMFQTLVPGGWKLW